ncbi:UNVERIFIED_ORG: hypothetical protein MaF1725_ph0081 [Mycobacterium phage ADLER F1725]
MLDYRLDCLDLHICSSIILQLIATILIVTVTNWSHTSRGDAAKPQVRRHKRRSLCCECTECATTEFGTMVLIPWF